MRGESQVRRAATGSRASQVSGAHVVVSGTYLGPWAGQPLPTLSPLPNPFTPAELGRRIGTRVGVKAPVVRLKL
jgi:hypothetical protein